MRAPSLIAAVLLGACSPPQQDGSVSSHGTDTTAAGGPYRIVGFDSIERKITDSLARANGVRSLQLWIKLPMHPSENEVVTIAQRVRDSVAQVHSDLWSLTLNFEAPGTVPTRDSRVARFTWGPNGVPDPDGKDTAPHKWGGRYNPARRDSVLTALSEYGQWFGDDRATVTSRFGPPIRVTTQQTRSRAYRYHPAASLSRADTFFVLEYANASFEVTVANADSLEMLWTIRVWGPVSKFPDVVSCGATTRAELVAMLGAADYTPDLVADTTVLSYQHGDIIEFHIVDDTLRLVAWRFRMG